MLVLLIIFLITIRSSRSRWAEAAEESNVPRQTKPENIEIAVTRDRRRYWGCNSFATTMSW